MCSSQPLPTPQGRAASTLHTPAPDRSGLGPRHHHMLRQVHTASRQLHAQPRSCRGLPSAARWARMMLEHPPGALRYTCIQRTSPAVHALGRWHARPLPWRSYRPLRLCPYNTHAYSGCILPSANRQSSRRASNIRPQLATLLHTFIIAHQVRLQQTKVLEVDYALSTKLLGPALNNPPLGANSKPLSCAVESRRLSPYLYAEEQAAQAGGTSLNTKRPAQGQAEPARQDGAETGESRKRHVSGHRGPAWRST